MTPEQIELVKSSWAKVLPISEQAAELFYGKLFLLDPKMKLLFKSDMEIQGRKLMTMLNIAVNSLDKLDVVIPLIQASGRRHVDYGVSEADYDTVGDALIWSLNEGLGDDFSDEVKTAWIKVYALLANTMKEAATETV